MGLDMYLNRKTFLWSADRKSVKIEGLEKYNIDPSKVSEITEQVMYWRKANEIHNWFVKNVQGGKDDCEEYVVSVDDLKKLHEVIIKVLKDKKLAPELLPTQEGFFFGGTEYDDYYWQDLKETEEVLGKILGEKTEGDYYYNSSW